MLSIKTATVSLIGGRDEQQDAVASWTSDNSCLIVLADGVGGNIGGAAAASAVIDAAAEIWDSSKGDFTSPEEQLTDIAKAAHEKICALSPNERRSPACTIVALYMDETSAHWIHCGDSRLYRINNQKVLSQTRDHSVIQLLFEQGEVTLEELNNHPDKNRILKSLGASSFKGVDYDFCSLLPGDEFLLCSDGYWESLQADAPIYPPCPENSSISDHLEQLAMQAVENNGPNGDNTTIAFASLKQTATNPTENEEPKTTKSLLALIILFTLLAIVFVFHTLFYK